MKNDPVNYGLIGFGGIAENRIAKEGFALDRTRFNEAVPMRLVAATDINPEKKDAAETLGIRWFDSIESLLASERIEAVFIATSNSSHSKIATQALEAGKHVMIEKPIATDLEEGRKLKTLAAEKNLSLCVDHMMTQNAYNIRCRDIIASGRLGTMDHIVLHMEFLYGATPDEKASWRCSKPEEFGGPIGDVGTHCLYMAEFLLDDRITSLSCTYTPPTLDIAVENGAIIRFSTKTGKNGTARVAFDQTRGGLSSTLSNLGFEVYGNEGCIRTRGTLFQLSGHPDEPIQQSIEQVIGDTTKYISLNDVNNIYQAQIAQHARSIRSGNRLDGSEALHNLEMVFACHESAKKGGILRSIET